MRRIVMVEIEDALGPYPAVVEGNGPDLVPRFNRHTTERIARDSQAPLGQLADMPGEGEYVRLVDGPTALEFYRLADGPVGERTELVWATMAGPDGRFPIPGERWPWQVAEGSRGQVWECCVSIIGPVCGHQAGL